MKTQTHDDGSTQTPRNVDNSESPTSSAENWNGSRIASASTRRGVIRGAGAGVLAAAFAAGTVASTDPAHAASSTTYYWENVKDHGATGNGTTDDTVAIQAALDTVKLGGGTVVFPPGNYLISSALKLDDVAQPVRLQGPGGGNTPTLSGATITYNAASGSAILAGSTQGLILSGLRFIYTNAAYQGNLIDFGWGTDPGHSGAKSSDASYNHLEDCFFGGYGPVLSRSQSLRTGHGREVVGEVEPLDYYNDRRMPLQMGAVRVARTRRKLLKHHFGPGQHLPVAHCGGNQKRGRGMAN